MHERVRPVLHRFVYPVFYVRVNLARLPELNSAWFGINRWRPAAIRTSDYGARDGSDLQQWMRALLRNAGVSADGEIWLQTFPRLFGFAFNPVSFWYCHRTDGALAAIVVEVNNTFGERHCYLLAGPELAYGRELRARKVFHVSPFCQIEGGYRFRFTRTAHRTVARVDHDDDAGPLLQTSVSGHLAALTPASVRQAFFGMPLMTLGVLLRIHSHALQLWLKRVPFVSKPAPPDAFVTR